VSANETATSNLGPHLLGRIPSEPDSRDYNLADYLDTEVVSPTTTDDPTLRDEAVAELKKTSRSYQYYATQGIEPPADTHWGKALALLAQIGGAAPTPTPTPTPGGENPWADPSAVLDQGQYGTCVGNGWSQWANSDPVNDKYDEGPFGVEGAATSGGPHARAVYYETTVLDGSPDDPDAPGGGQQGATVRNGAKVMKARGRLSAYASAATLDDALAFLAKSGTVVVGSDWMNDMFSPDSNGVVKPTGGVAGGHCYLMIGYDAATGLIEFLNSWGSGWAKGGRFFMHKADFQTLFASGGELWAAVELAA